MFGCNLCLGMQLNFETPLQKLEIEEDGVKAISSSGKEEHFEFVILGMPAPQILALTDIDKIIGWY